MAICSAPCHMTAIYTSVAGNQFLVLYSSKTSPSQTMGLLNDYGICLMTPVKKIVKLDPVMCDSFYNRPPCSHKSRTNCMIKKRSQSDCCDSVMKFYPFFIVCHTEWWEQRQHLNPASLRSSMAEVPHWLFFSLKPNWVLFPFRAIFISKTDCFKVNCSTTRMEVTLNGKLDKIFLISLNSNYL